MLIIAISRYGSAARTDCRLRTGDTRRRSRATIAASASRGDRAPLHSGQRS
jgi:hypothetical protein